MTTPDSPLGRRAAFALLGSSLLAVALAACAGAGEPMRSGGRARRRDEVPFWLREEQRDD